MVAELQLTNLLPELAVDGVLERELGIASKDKTKIEDQSGDVYRNPCGGCNKVYAGVTKRTVGERIKGVLHPWTILWLFMYFSQKLQHIGDK